MLLIIILGSIANVASVLGDCDIGNHTLNDFDWSKFSGHRRWYTLLHNSNEFENNIECLATLILTPEGDRSFMKTDVYDISKKRPTTFYGYATNWNSTGYFDVYYSFPLWNGRVYVLAVDYDRYFIARFCFFDFNKSYDYVTFRNQHPDEETEKEILKKLRDKNIDAQQLVELRTDRCQLV